MGLDHETIGSDIQAVLQSLTFPLSILGAETTERLAQIQADGWYPIETLLDLMEVLDQRLGDVALRKLGRTLFKVSHAPRLRGVLRSAHDVVYGIDAMYHHANRGKDIGGWRVASFTPGRAELHKTTPHHCVMEEGILLEALALCQAPANIEQLSCFRRGDELCRYVITSAVTDQRWMGG